MQVDSDCQTKIGGTNIIQNHSIGAEALIFAGFIEPQCANTYGYQIGFSQNKKRVLYVQYKGTRAEMTKLCFVGKLPTPYYSKANTLLRYGLTRANLNMSVFYIALLKAGVVYEADSGRSIVLCNSYHIVHGSRTSTEKQTR